MINPWAHHRKAKPTHSSKRPTHRLHLFFKRAPNTPDSATGGPAAVVGGHPIWPPLGPIWPTHAPKAAVGGPYAPGGPLGSLGACGGAVDAPRGRRVNFKRRVSRLGVPWVLRGELRIERGGVFVPAGATPQGLVTRVVLCRAPPFSCVPPQLPVLGLPECIGVRAGPCRAAPDEPGVIEHTRSGVSCVRRVSAAPETAPHPPPAVHAGRHRGRVLYSTAM